MDSKAISITKLNFLLNQTLELSVGEVAFEGEISELTVAPSGHCYLTLKDEQSQISAVMWRSSAARLKFRPKIGDAVLCVGTPNVYTKNGRLQIVLQSMQQAGDGELRRKFEELKLKLEREGLFAVERKRKLPFIPKAIGVVTSKTGAVIHDIMVKLQERMPQIPVYLDDARVQGEGAAAEIARGVELLNRANLVDVIIVARGGGSLEDLWPFNEEVVVRAVFASKLPVISGVGHEVDVSLCDLAADVRAPTPTAAAEMVVPRRDELLTRLDEFERRFLDYDRYLAPHWQELDNLYARLDRQITVMQREKQLSIKTLESRLKNIEPSVYLRHNAEKLSVVSKRLSAALSSRINFEKNRLDSMRFIAPNITQHSDKLSQLEKRLAIMIDNRIGVEKSHIDSLFARLENTGPKQVLKRGYAILQGSKGLISNVRDVSVGDELKITVSNGAVNATAVSILEGE